jgi:glycosyltransferase involved in cell wall biosynthesis
MPSFNQGRYIEEAICSVLNQNYPAFELIVIDGGSSDNTVAILERYSSRIAHWVSEPDRGQTHAVNKGLKCASGEIIGWLNSDDKYVSGTFRKVAVAFGNHPEAILVHGNRILMDANSQVSGWAKLPAFDPETTGFIVCSETAFWRSSAVLKERLKEDLRFAMDLEYFLRLYHLGTFVKSEAFLGYFRCHSENKSSTIAHIGESEAEREWTRIMGGEHTGWRNRPRCYKVQQAYALISNPMLILLPYLYRRLVIGRRGL